MTDLREIFDGREQAEGGSTDRVIRLLNDIKNRLRNAVDNKTLAKNMDVKVSELLRPKEFSLDLTKAHDNEIFNLSGSKIVIPKITGKADLRFEPNDKPIPLQTIHEIPNQYGFTEFYLSNEAQKKGTELTGLVTTIGGGVSAPATQRLTYRSISAVLDSTTSPLTSGSTYTGESFSVDGYQTVLVSFYADQDALVRVQFTNDETNWDAEHEYDYTAGESLGMRVDITGSEGRIQIENDSGANMSTIRAYVRSQV